MSLFISNLQKKIFVPPEWADLLATAAAQTLAVEGQDMQGEISVVFVDDRKIEELNARYRGVAAPTDVLAFAQREKQPEEPLVVEGEEDLLWGDIVVSLETAQEQAKEYGCSLEEEVVRLFLHGLLHLLGADDSTPSATAEMHRREEEILNELGFKSQ